MQSFANEILIMSKVCVCVPPLPAAVVFLARAVPDFLFSKKEIRGWNSTSVEPLSTDRCRSHPRSTCSMLTKFPSTVCVATPPSSVASSAERHHANGRVVGLGCS